MAIGVRGSKAATKDNKNACAAGEKKGLQRSPFLF